MKDWISMSSWLPSWRLINQMVRLGEPKWAYPMHGVSATSLEKDQTGENSKRLTKVRDSKGR